MPDRPCATDGSDQEEAAEGGYFARLASARYLRLTTFKRDGMPVSATVHGLVDGDWAYFRARSRSGTAKRLRHTDAVQVTACSVLGLCTYGPPLDAIARPLPAGEVSRAAAALDREYLTRRRLPIPLSRRKRRQEAVYYELLAEDAAGGEGGLPGGHAASLVIRVDASQGLMYADAATPTSLAPACTPSSTDSRPSHYTRIITVSMSLPARTPAAETRADQATATTSASSHIS